MIEYPKTENLFARDPDTHKLIVGQFRDPHFEQVAYWHVTEKIDGTNMRVIYDPLAGSFEIRGRSDRAQIQRDLELNMAKMFTVEKLSHVFDGFIGDERIAAGAKVTLFGEGYGPGIQKGGGGYRKDKSFRLFDVMYHWPDEQDAVELERAGFRQTYRNSWCQPTTTMFIAGELNIPLAPVLGLRLTIDDILQVVSNQIGREPGHVWSSATAKEDGGDGCASEGVIARTDPYLYNERGSRVMFKLKGADLA